MAKFFDLPLEIVLDIIERCLESSESPRCRSLELSNLSQVCKYLNNALGPQIFKTYRLQLREAREDGRSDPKCFLTGTSLLTWDQDGFDARLNHLRKKANFVRELRIVDYGQQVGIFEEESGPAPFGSTLEPALLEALYTLVGVGLVVSVVFEGTKHYLPVTYLPSELWDWLSSLQPNLKQVIFDGYFKFPDTLRALPSVKYMSLFMTVEASGAIDAVRPAFLDLEVETADRLGTYFKEIFEPYPSLEQLDVRYRYYDPEMPPRYFDFTLHPNAKIVIHMVVPDTEAYIEAAGAWAETEMHLKEVFVDDVTKLDFRRNDGSNTVVISRPPSQQTGGIRDLHLLASDQDQEMFLAYEQAIFAHMSCHEIPNDADPWTNMDEVMATVYFQTFKPLVVSEPAF